jgi:CDP-glucose 4,6-dehydratase
VTAAASYTDRSVLVTGAHGFIGSWLVERLLAEGARVLVPRRVAPEGSRLRVMALEARCDLLSLDLLDLRSLLRALEEHQIDTVFHLAARISVGGADMSPLPAFETNVRGTYNLLEACRVASGEAATRHVVVASSANVYGDRAPLRCPETAPLRPVRPYAASKACADMIARCYAVTHDVPVAVIRMSNVFGGGDLNFARLVPASAKALVAGDAPALTSDGTPERDFLYVEDAVDAYLAVEQSLIDRELWGRAWNAGGERPIATAEMVRRLAEISGTGVELGVPEDRSSSHEVDRRWLDSTAIRDALGWTPRWPLADALQKTYAWYEEQPQTGFGQPQLGPFADTTNRY